MLFRSIGGRGADTEDNGRASEERSGADAHRGHLASVQPIEERRAEKERGNVLLQRERIRNPGEEDQGNDADEYEKTDFP